MNVQYTNEEAMLLVQHDGFNLANLSDIQKNNKDIVMAAVTKRGVSLQFASYALRKNKDIVLAAVNQEGWALQYANQKLQGDKSIVLLAVGKEAAALEYASEELRNDREVVLKAVTVKGGVLGYASDRLKRDYEIIITAMLHCVVAYGPIDYVQQHNPSVLYVLEHKRYMLDKDISMIKRALIEKPEYFLNPEPYIKALTADMDYPYLMLAQYALNKDVIIASESYPEVLFEL